MHQTTNERATLGVAHEADHDRVVLALLEAGRLSVAEALRRDLVERELGHVLEEWSRRWTEAR